LLASPVPRKRFVHDFIIFSNRFHVIDYL
jgi:hypothetical protein